MWQVLHGLRDTCQRVNMFQKTCKTLGYMNNIVCKMTPGGGKAICIPCPIFFFRYLACVDLESLYVYKANFMHDLASNTELDSKNHIMKVVLTQKFRWDVKNQNKQNKHV